MAPFIIAALVGAGLFTTGAVVHEQNPRLGTALEYAGVGAVIGGALGTVPAVAAATATVTTVAPVYVGATVGGTVGAVTGFVQPVPVRNPRR